MPRRDDIKSVLVIGSGPIVIGQAAEFDYAGTQACRALREEGVRVVLVNSNPATIMTDEGVADVTYIEPLTVEVAASASSRASGRTACWPTLGGQTGLNLAVAAGRGGRPRRVRRAAARHAARGDPARPRTASCSSSCSIDLGEPVAAERDRRRRSRTRWRCAGDDRLARRDPAGLHARRHRRRHRAHAATSSTRIAERGLARQPDRPGAGRAVPRRLEGDRVRGDARRRRHLHHHLQHGELRPDGRPHRRQHRRRAQPDALRPRVPDAAHARRCASSARSASRAAATSSSRSTRTRSSFYVIEVNPRVSRSSALASQGDRLSRSRASRPRSPSACGWTRSPTR